MNHVATQGRYIDMKQDALYRMLGFLFVTPFVLKYFHFDILEQALGHPVTIADFNFVVVNSSALIVLMLGIFFMRGHNNRNVLAFDGFVPAAMWQMIAYFQAMLGKMSLPWEGLSPDVAAIPHFAAYFVSAFFHIGILLLLMTRVRWENKALFYIGKLVPGTRKYVLDAVSSKGTTNYQTFVLSAYTLMVVLTVAQGVFYVANLLYFGIEQASAHHTGAPSAFVDEMYGFSMFRLVHEMGTWVYAIVNICMLYYIMTDYVKPDQFGRDDKVRNFVGSGMKKLRIK